MPRRTWLRVALRAGVVENDADTARKTGANLVDWKTVEAIGVARGRRVAGENSWRTIDPTIFGYVVVVLSCLMLDAWLS
jgi:hypothetical protein